MPIDPHKYTDAERYQHVQAEYNRYLAQPLALDLTRGKPSVEQLNLSDGLLMQVDPQQVVTEEGIDCRNYGEPDGLPGMRRLMADFMSVEFDQVVVPSSNSLQMMDYTLLNCLTDVPVDGQSPWYECKERAFLCPSPGYDRHFYLTEQLGFRLIPVKMNADGPDLKEVRALVADDPTIKGMWCVPVYSNPTGNTYSADVCRELAAMETAAPDFKLMWDLAYCQHHFRPGAAEEHVPNMIELCARYGHPNRVFVFASFSKVTFPGSSVAGFASSPANLAWYRKHLQRRQIGPDKMTQLQHVLFFRNFAGIKAHMQAQAVILREHFKTVENGFRRRLADLPDVSWSEPNGGYFIALYLPQGTAKRVVELAKNIGVKLTPAGNPFPYGKDPNDSFLRIAPTYPPLEEVERATEAIALCVELACLEKNGSSGNCQ